MFPSLNVLFRIRHNVSSSEGLEHNARSHNVSSSEGLEHNARKFCNVNTYFFVESTDHNSVVSHYSVENTEERRLMKWELPSGKKLKEVV
jgi:hypothetical protein